MRYFASSSNRRGPSRQAHIPKNLSSTAQARVENKEREREKAYDCLREFFEENDGRFYLWDWLKEHLRAKANFLHDLLNKLIRGGFVVRQWFASEEGYAYKRVQNFPESIDLLKV